MSTACVLRDNWLDRVPEDGTEGDTMVVYNGAPVKAYWTVYTDGAEVGLEIDGVEHGDLSLDADDMTDAMRNSLARAVRAAWKREAEAAA